MKRKRMKSLVRKIAICVLGISLISCNPQQTPSQQSADMKLLNMQAGDCKISVQIDSKSKIIDNEIKRTNTEPALLHLATVSTPDSALADATIYSQFFALENDDKNDLRMRARFLLETQSTKILEEIRVDDGLYMFAQSKQGKVSDYHFRQFKKTTIVLIRTLLNAKPTGPQPESLIFKSLKANNC